MRRTFQTNLLPGFSSPAFESQDTFRKVLNAMAYPMRPVSFGKRMDVPKPLYPTTGAICLTLLDLETRVWMDLGKNTEVADWLEFHCGCPLVDSPSLANFGLISQGDEDLLLDQFPIGEDEFPERSTTLIIQVAGFTPGAGRTFRGPGIRSEERLEVYGLSETFWKAWSQNRRLYPLGIDVLLTSPTAIVGLPRTTEATE